LTRCSSEQEATGQPSVVALACKPECAVACVLVFHFFLFLPAHIDNYVIIYLSLINTHAYMLIYIYTLRYQKKINLYTTLINIAACFIKTKHVRALFVCIYICYFIKYKVIL
jgi:hypothetical protein